MTTTEATWTDDKLADLRALVKLEETSGWEIGDLLLDLLPVGPVGVKTGVAATIRALAAEVDAEPNTLTMYRKVAHGWPDGTRVPSATWAAHRAYMGPPASAAARSKTLSDLPRNEHGKITAKAVHDLTKAGSRGEPGWMELLGRVGDSLLAAEKHLDKITDVVANRRRTRPPGYSFREKADEYADWADRIAAGLRDIDS